MNRVAGADQTHRVREPPPMPSAPGKKKVVATGCYDWFHSGHVRFTEEASEYGDLYVCLGNDANVLLLKGPSAAHAGRTPLRRRLHQICETGGHHHRLRLGGRRSRNQAVEAGHLRRQRRWRQRRQTRILPGTRHRISCPQTHARARRAHTLFDALIQAGCRCAAKVRGCVQNCWNA